jgi:hypothetical protein
MKKNVPLTILVIVVIILGIYSYPESNSQQPAPLESGIDLSTSSEVSETHDTNIIDLEAEWAALSRLAHAFALVESNDNPNAVNRKENAVGLLQIRPCMIAEANRIVGENIYTLSDRWDSITSIAIFHSVMMAKNPSLDVDKAIEIWNPNATPTYRHSILSILTAL